MNTRTNTTNDTANKRPLTYILWTIQILLTLLFLFAGIVKLIMPIATLTQQSKLPGMLFRVVAVAEVLGALGLILPGFFRIRTGLTPLAAAGLLIIMIGATVDVDAMEMSWFVVATRVSLRRAGRGG